jgi:hypothetical protein
MNRDLQLTHYLILLIENTPNVIPFFFKKKKRKRKEEAIIGSISKIN